MKKQIVDKIVEVHNFIEDVLDYGYFSKVSYVVDEEFGEAWYFRMLIETLGDSPDHEISMQINLGEPQIETSEDIYEDFELNSKGEAQLWRVLFWGR